ncbi:hypothetical protein D3C87_1619690 [compost metagenome]
MRTEYPAVERHLQIFELHRFAQVIDQRTGRTALAIHTLGNHEHRQLRATRQRANLAAHGYAVHWLQLVIEQHGVNRFTLQEIQRSAGAVSSAHAKPELEQHAAHHQLIDLVVIDQQHRAVLWQSQTRKILGHERR